MKISKIIAIVVIAIVFTSCKKSKKEINPVKNEKTGTMSVEVNGTVWTGTCGAVDAKIGAGTNVTILSNNSPKEDLISITLVGFAGTGDYSANFKTESGLTLVYNGLNYKYDKKSTDPLTVKITESSLPTTPLGPGKIAGEFSGTFKNVEGGKSIVLTKGKFQTTDIL
jgi:hypothetical protein